MLLPISVCGSFFHAGFHRIGRSDGQCGELVLGEVRSRLGYLCDVGLGYLTLDRQEPHTLRRRGAAYQPHHCAWHVATNATLFVLDEPSIGQNVTT